MSGQTAQIRPMTAADLDQVVEIAQALQQAPHWPRTAYLDAMNPTATPCRIALVARAPQKETSEASGSILGFAVASLVSPQAELETIAVAAEAQRQGVARRLLAALNAELLRLGSPKLLSKSALQTCLQSSFIAHWIS